MSDPTDERLIRQYPAVRRLAAAQLLSSFGSGLVAVVFTYAAYSLTGTVMSSILVALAYALPSVVLLRVTGPLLQRFDPKRVTMIEVGVSVAVYLVFAVIAARGPLTMAFLLVASAIEGALTAFAIPAWRRLMRATAPEGRLDELNAVVAASFSLGSLVGILAGGWVYEELGASWSFLLNGVTYAPLALALAALPIVTPSVVGARRRARLREALPAFRDVPLLRAVVLIELLLVLLCWPLLQFVPQIAHEVSASARAFSAVIGSYYLGAVLVAPTMRWLVARESHRAILLQCLAALALLMAVIGVSGRLGEGPVHLGVLMALLALFGLALGLAGVVLSTTLESGAPAETSGAVYALYSSAVSVLQILVALALGALLVHMPVWWVVASMGVVLALLAAAVRRREVVAAFAALDAAPTTPRHPGHSAVPGIGRLAGLAHRSPEA